MVKNPPAKAGDMGSIPGSGRSPGERNGNPLQYSCLGNPRDRGTWHATVHGIAKSQLNNIVSLLRAENVCTYYAQLKLNALYYASVYYFLLFKY